MNRAGMFVQAARGPILLITIGTLFALQQSGAIAFSRTWPLVIIVIGVMKLIERVIVPRPAFVPPPPAATWAPAPGAYRPAGPGAYTSGPANPVYPPPPSASPYTAPSAPPPPPPGGPRL